MATIVRHRPTDRHFVLLGASYSKWRSSRASPIFGDLVPVDEEGATKALTVCDAQGQVHFYPAAEFEVVEIDRKAPADILGETNAP